MKALIQNIVSYPYSKKFLKFLKNSNFYKETKSISLLDIKDKLCNNFE